MAKQIRARMSTVMIDTVVKFVPGAARAWAALCISAVFATAAAPAPEGASARAAAQALPAPDSTHQWGYGYDSLLLDLEQWRQHPEVKIDSIGASVQGRAIWMVSITDASDSL